MSQSLVRLLATTPEPPCETHQCSNKARCSSERLACQAFAAYVHEGRSVPPAMQLRKDRWGRTQGAVGDIARPTRAIYLRLYSRDDLSLRDFVVDPAQPKEHDDGNSRPAA